MKTNLTSQDVVQWLKAQTKILNGMADQIETIFKSAALSQGAMNSSIALVSSREPVTPDAVKALLVGKLQRVNQIASRLGVSADEVQAIINNPANGLEIISRGWVTVKAS